MQITVEIDGQPVEFRRNWFTGSATLRAGETRYPLQSALDPGTHFSFDLVQRWHCRIASHVVTVEKQRPRVFGGFRPQTFRILVDGKLVAEQRGF